MSRGYTTDAGRYDPAWTEAARARKRARLNFGSRSQTRDAYTGPGEDWGGERSYIPLPELPPGGGSYSLVNTAEGGWLAVRHENPEMDYGARFHTPEGTEPGNNRPAQRFMQMPDTPDRDWKIANRPPVGTLLDRGAVSGWRDPDVVLKSKRGEGPTLPGERRRETIGPRAESEIDDWNLNERQPAIGLTTEIAASAENESEREKDSKERARYGHASIEDARMRRRFRDQTGTPSGGTLPSRTPHTPSGGSTPRSTSPLQATAPSADEEADREANARGARNRAMAEDASRLLRAINEMHRRRYGLPHGSTLPK